MKGRETVVTPVKFNSFNVRISTSYPLHRWREVQEDVKAFNDFVVGYLGGTATRRRVIPYKSVTYDDDRLWAFEETITFDSRKYAISELSEIFYEVFYLMNWEIEVSENLG